MRPLISPSASSCLSVSHSIRTPPADARPADSRNKGRDSPPNVAHWITSFCQVRGQRRTSRTRSTAAIWELPPALRCRSSLNTRVSELCDVIRRLDVRRFRIGVGIRARFGVGGRSGGRWVRRPKESGAFSRKQRVFQKKTAPRGRRTYDNSTTMEAQVSARARGARRSP
jgi:hypothetical protein